MLEYAEYSSTMGVTDLNEFGNTVNDSVKLLNDFFKFKKDYMEEYSIFDTIIEYSNKFDYNYEYLAQELSEIPGFVDIVNNDCNKFKYNAKKPLNTITDDFD